MTLSVAMMMKRLCLSCCYLWLLLATTTTVWAHPLDEAKNNTPEVVTVVVDSKVQSSSSSSSEEQTVVLLTEPCTALVKEIMADVDRAKLQCYTPNDGMLYTIPFVETAWIRQKQNEGLLLSGETTLDIPPNTTWIDVNTQTLQLDAPPKLVNSVVVVEESVRRNRRRLATRNKASGIKTVLVVRVQATNRATTKSEAELADDIFGDQGDVNNLRSQYSACSFNKFIISKAKDRNGRSAKIRNGVVTIHPGMATNVGDDRMLNAIYSQLRTQFSTDPTNLADFIMFCLPHGTTDIYDIAYAWMNDHRSVYNDIHCSHVSAQMHELGHNLNMAHSGMGDNEYADKSGMMGYSYAQDDIPFMCFNAAKSWQLGWYADKAVTILPLAQGMNEYSGRLAALADYPTADTNVLIKIQQTRSPWAFFMNYNAAKGMNVDTMDGRNKIMITMKDTRNEGNQSRLIASLEPGEKLSINSFNGIKSETLHVKFASLTDDVADVSIQLTGPNVPVPTPETEPRETSIAPSDMPSATPTSQPTIIVPSDLPSEAPSTPSPSNVSVRKGVDPTALPSSHPPSLSPTEYPSALASEQPSILPSDTPSQQPSTSFPSYSPSFRPSTSFPSLLPSLQASAHPSIQPSTSMPSARPSVQSSGSPSFQPSTSMPSVSPSNQPTKMPSFQPSSSPTFEPSSLPSQSPSNGPSAAPSLKPSLGPSHVPSSMPSAVPSRIPSQSPSMVPSSAPTYTISFSFSSPGVAEGVTISCIPIGDFGTPAIREEKSDLKEGTTLSCEASQKGKNGKHVAFIAMLTPRIPSQNEQERALNTLFSSNDSIVAINKMIHGEKITSSRRIVDDKTLIEIDSKADPPILSISFEYELRFEDLFVKEKEHVWHSNDGSICEEPCFRLVKFNGKGNTGPSSPPQRHLSTRELDSMRTSQPFVEDSTTYLVHTLHPTIVLNVTKMKESCSRVLTG
eukprot:scaffold4335_cov119-Cylindrotheca_fusiformis.AAC.9